VSQRGLAGTDHAGDAEEHVERCELRGGGGGGQSGRGRLKKMRRDVPAINSLRETWTGSRGEPGSA
jgi:hypothetical protein